MKFKTLLLFSTIFFSYSLFAQEISPDYEVSWSQPNQYQDDLFIIGTKKTDAGYLTFVKEAKKKRGEYNYFIELFDNNLNFERKVDVSEQVDQDNYTVEEVLNYNGNFVLITSRYFKKERKEEFYFQTIDENSNAIIGEKVKIHEEIHESKKQRSKIELSISPNDKYLLVKILPKWYTKHEKSLSLILFDQNLNIEWSNSNVFLNAGLADEKSLIFAYDIIVNDSGEVYFLLRHNEETNSSYEIVSLIEGEFTGETIDLDDERLKVMHIQLSIDNTLHAIGFYTENPEGNSNQGVASYVIAPDLSSITSEDFMLYDVNYLREIRKGKDLAKVEKQIEKNEELFEDLKFETIMKHKDGSVTFIGEFQDNYTYTSGSGDNQITKTRYIYGNLFLTRIESNGEIISNSTLYKQNTFSRAMPKHNLLLTSNDNIVRIRHEVRLIFKNIDPNKDEKEKLLSAVIIDKDGEQTEKIIFDPAGKSDHKKATMGNIATNAFVLSNNEIILLFKLDKKEYKICRVTSLLEN